MQGEFNTCKEIKVIQLINRSKDKNYLIISIDAKKPFNKIPHHFMISALRKQGIEGMYVKVTKAVYDKHVASIILNGNKLKPLSLNSGMRQEYLFSPLTLGFLAITIMQEEEIKGIQIYKETVKIFPFADDMILFLNDPKNSPSKLLNSINSLSNVPGYKINLQKSIGFLYTNSEQIEKEYRKTTPVKIA
jgi:hypothetical protein